jgi:GT2 family glycosyltransferase
VRSGYRLIYAPEAVVAHNRTLTLRSFIAQHMGYGHGAFKYYRQWRGTTKQGERLFFFRAMRNAARESLGLEKLWAPALVLLSQAAVFAGMIRGAAADLGKRSALGTRARKIGG